MMHTTLMLGGAISLAAWLYLLLARGGFWRIRKPLISAAGSENSDLTIVAVIPARDEADVVGRAVTSLLQQETSAKLHVVLVDDGSTDGTAEVARAAAAASNKTDRLTVLQGTALPTGWSGKIWAQQQGVTKALEFSPDYLLLTDADIEHGTTNVATLTILAEENGNDLTSFMVKLHCGSWFERWLIPAFVFFFFMLYPPAWIADRKRKLSGAAGGCTLIRPAALTLAGGLEAIRGEIIDDCALAAAVKRSGGTVGLSPTETARSIRPYKSVGEIGRMISRSAFNQLDHSVLLLAGTIVGLIIVYLLPIVLLFAKTPLPLALGILSCVAMMATYLPMIWFYGLNPAWALSLPAAAGFYIGATIHSAACYWQGTGGMWKGRVQDRSGVRA